MLQDREKNGKEVFLLFLTRDTRKRFRETTKKREKKREREKGVVEEILSRDRISSPCEGEREEMEAG